MDDLDNEERLEAGIARIVKMLWQLKMADDLEPSREPRLIGSVAANKK